MKGLIKLLVAPSFLITFQLQGQEEITADLADQTTSPQVVEPNLIQTEFAISYTRFLTGDKIVCVNPLSHVRFGLIKGVELGIAVEEGLNRDAFVERTTQGMYPLSLSGKLQLYKDDQSMVSLISHVQLPFTAHRREQAGYWSPMLMMSFDRIAGEFLKFTVNLGMQRQPFETSWSLPVNFGVGSKLSSFITVSGNYYAQFPFSDVPQHNAGLGIEFQLTKDLEIFASGGRTINPEDENIFIAGGVVLRFHRRN
jgi:hypothetical protein